MELKTQWGFLWMRQFGDRYLNPLVMLSTRRARCGHKLRVAYRSRPGEAPRYYCMTGNKEQGKPSCLSFAAYKVEKAVVEIVLEACQPMGIEASLQVLTAESIEQDQKERRLELALERLRYEAEYTQR
jgi:hypothetical protein